MSLTKPNLNDTDENMAKDKYEQLQLRLRKRIFTSLHYLPKFKSLTKEAQNFLFNQIKGDYIEFEVLKKPILTIENASLLAALAL